MTLKYKLSQTKRIIFLKIYPFIFTRNIKCTFLLIKLKTTMPSTNPFHNETLTCFLKKFLFAGHNLQIIYKSKYYQNLYILYIRSFAIYFQIYFHHTHTHTFLSLFSTTRFQFQEKASHQCRISEFYVVIIVTFTSGNSFKVLTNHRA